MLLEGRDISFHDVSFDEYEDEENITEKKKSKWQYSNNKNDVMIFKLLHALFQGVKYKNMYIIKSS